jgi:hypothetical protein
MGVGMRYQPQGRIRAKQSGLARGLVFAAGPGGEAITNRPGILYGGATKRGGKLGQSISTSGTTSGAEFAGSPDLYSITTDVTIIVLMSATASVAYSHMLCVPFSAGSWPGPAYGSIGLQAYTDGATLRLWGDASTGNRIGLVGSAATRLLTDGLVHMYGAAKDASGAVIFRDTTIEPAADIVDNASASRSFVWSTKNPVNLLNRNRNAAGEGTSGQMCLATVWNRKLSNEELASFYANPWQVFEDGEDDDISFWRAAAGYVLNAAASGFALAGQAVGLRVARRIAASASSFVAGGSLAAMIAARRMTAGPGTISVAGAAARFASARRLVGSSGSYGLAAPAAKVLAARSLRTAAAGFVLDGIPAKIRALRNLAGDPAQFAVGERAARLRAARRLVSGPGSISLSGADINLVYVLGKAGYVLAAASGGFGLVSLGAVLHAHRRMTAGAGSLSLVGAAAKLVSGRKLVAAQAGFVLQATAVVTRAARRIAGKSAAFDTVVADAQLSYSGQIEYARAPAGPGYTPQQHYNESRPAATSSPRPAAIQRNYR